MAARVLHIICGNNCGVNWESDSVFTFAPWVGTRNNVGWIALHEHRFAPSYVQGSVIASWVDPERPARKVFRVMWLSTSATWPRPIGSGILQYGRPEMSFPNADAFHPPLGFEDASSGGVGDRLPRVIVPVDSLYVMVTQGNDSRVTVGRSHNPTARAHQLSAGHPELIVVFHAWPRRGHLERFVHDRLMRLRLQNGGPGQEWFNVNANVAVMLIELLISVVDTVDAFVSQST